MSAARPSLTNVQVSWGKVHGSRVLAANDLEVPPVTEWKTSTGVALADPEYLRAYQLSRQSLVQWFRVKHPRQTMGRRERKAQFLRRLPFWAHVVADYALWVKVEDSLRPKEWPTTTTGVARLHGLALGELSILLFRARFKLLVKRLYPPIPTYLFIDRLDQKIMKHALDEALWQKHPDKARALAELAYKRYGIIKTHGAGINILNQNNAGSDAREVPDEQALAAALALVAPYMPKLLPKEVPPAAEEVAAPEPDQESAPQGLEPDPEGDCAP